MVNPRGLSDRQRAVVATMRMRLSRRQALLYVEGEGFPMSESTYGRIKAWLKRSTLERLHQIAQFEFRDQHLERIDNVEIIAKLMWQNYHLEKSPYKKTLILKEITQLQPYISSYYDTTRMVLEVSAKPVVAARQGNPSLPESPETQRET